MSSGLNLDVVVLGQSLTLAQKLAVKNSLLRIKLQENKQDVRFWGKINGTQADYLVAVSTHAAESLHKSFYYSVDDGATFSLLPTPDAFVSNKAAKVRGPFSGNPALKHKDPDAPPKRDEDGNVIEEDEEEDGEEEEVEEEQAFDEEEVDDDGNSVPRPPPPRRLTELERLAWSVQQIESDTCVVPRGSWSMSATGAIARNTAFAGLSAEQARKIESYQLLRDAREPATLAAIRAAGVSNHHDFLDPLVSKNARVKHTWSVQASESGLEVSLRSLLYPGYEFTLEAASLDYAGGYFGTGEKNGDLLFMI